MKINESTFRKILREEARRTLREAPAVPTAAGTTATPMVGGNVMGGPTQGPQTPEVAAATQQSKTFVEQGLNSLAANIDGLIATNSNVPGVLTARSNLSATFKNLDSPEAANLAPALLKATQAKGGLNDKALAVIATLALKKNPQPLDWYRYLVDVGIKLDQTAATYKVDTIDKAAASVQQYASNPIATGYVKAVSAIAQQIINNASVLAGNFQKYKQSATSRPAPALTPMGKSYTVVKGDTVAAIAQKFYGIAPSNAAMPAYQQIVGQGNNPNAIKVGQQLTLPATLAIGQKVYPLKAAVA